MESFDTPQNPRKVNAEVECMEVMEKRKQEEQKIVEDIKLEPVQVLKNVRSECWNFLWVARASCICTWPRKSLFVINSNLKNIHSNCFILFSQKVGTI